VRSSLLNRLGPVLDRVRRAALVRRLTRMSGSASDREIARRLTTDKHGEPLLVRADRCGSSLLVRAFRAGSQRHEAVLFATLEGDRATLRDIGGFSPGAVNRGVGTALLRLAEEVFRGAGVRRVVGYLAPTDPAHRERQVHFYLKNGYDVTLNGGVGRLEKVLSPSPWTPNDWPSPRLGLGRLRRR